MTRSLSGCPLIPRAAAALFKSQSLRCHTLCLCLFQSQCCSWCALQDRTECSLACLYLFDFVLQHSMKICTKPQDIRRTRPHQQLSISAHCVMTCELVECKQDCKHVSCIEPIVGLRTRVCSYFNSVLALTRSACGRTNAPLAGCACVLTVSESRGWRVRQLDQCMSVKYEGNDAVVVYGS